MKTIAKTVAALFLTALLTTTYVNVRPIWASSSTTTRHFRLLAIETQYDSCRMRSAQILIKELLRYQNWNNATTEYVSHIHLLSMYKPEELDSAVKPFLKGFSSEAAMKNEILNFLGQATPGEIVIFYYCGHGDYGKLLLPDGKVQLEELHRWLLSGGLPQALVTVILDTCNSGSWILDGEGGLFGFRRIVMASSRSAETSWGWCGFWSWFTYVGVIEGFQFAEDLNKDGWISAAEDFAYAKPHTKSYALQFGKKQNPTGYFDLADGDVPLVQRDVTKPFPLWDVAVIHAETSIDVILAGAIVNVTVIVENQGFKKWNPLITVYYDSSLAVNEVVNVSPGETLTLSLAWNTSGTYEGSYVISVMASVGPGEIDIADNTFVDGVVKVYNAIIELKPKNLKLKSAGSWIICSIEFPEVFDIDVSEIDVSSVKLGAKVQAETLFEIKDYNQDGIPTVMVKFNREDVVSYILSIGVGEYIAGFSRWVTLRVVGKLFSGVSFEGYDTIKVTFHPLWQESK